MDFVINLYLILLISVRGLMRLVVGEAFGK
jgi:hypothetical protein